jgi:hypothetical protein
MFGPTTPARISVHTGAADMRMVSNGLSGHLFFAANWQRTR